MSIRSSEQSDYSAILEIYANSKLDELSYEGEAFELLPLDQDPKRFASFKESDVYVYEKAGAVVAYAALFESEIRSLYVHSNVRGQGIGRELLEFALSKIEGSATLNVAKNNQPAIELYRQYGFEIVNEFTASYNGVDAVANTMAQIVEP